MRKRCFKYKVKKRKSDGENGDDSDHLYCVEWDVKLYLSVSEIALW